MTAHSHSPRGARPVLCTTDQIVSMGSVEEWGLLTRLVDAFWNECEVCIEEAVSPVASSPGAFMALRRAYRLQETGQLKWAHGTAEGDAETAKLGGVQTATMRQLALAAGRMWVARAQLFAEIGGIGKCDGEPRVLERPKVNRPGQRNRQR
jgi:hypothetical protein